MLRICMLGAWLLAFGAVAWAQHAVRPPAFDEAASGARKFQLMPGLTLGVWAAEPQLSNSVAFCFDGRGRVFLAESDRWAISVFDITAHTNWLLEDMSFRDVGDRSAFLTREFATNLTLLTRDSEVVRLLEDQDSDGRADHSEIIADGFRSPVDGTAAGILATRDRLYFANIPNLWSFSISASTFESPPGDPNSSPRPMKLEAERVASGFGVHIGVSGHDLHGLIRGHDGRIYMSFGDRGCVMTNREGVVIRLPDTGGVLRCEPDGRNLEVFCRGLRNPQELAFDDLGNLWTVDNDTAGADPCRVLHLVEGADYGWRTSYQHIDGFGPWVQEELWKGGQDGILPPAGTVSQGPSGLAYYPGTGFGSRLAGTFLHCDFPGGVTALTVKPQGASYAVDRKEKFLWNCWPTDVDFGPDGAAYVLDWVSGWGQTPRGRIYRIAPTDPVGADGDPALVAQVRQLLGEGMAQRDPKALLELLGHPDRRVRLEAQWELASRGALSIDGLIWVAKGRGNRLAQLHALWALGQIFWELPMTQGAGDLAQLLELLEDADEEVRGQAAILVLGVGRLMNAEGPVRDLFEDPSPRVRWMAVQAFAHRLRVPGYGAGKVRVHFTSRQEALGKVIAGAAAVVGATNSIEWESRLGTTVAGSFPVAELARMLARDPVDPYITQAAIQFLSTPVHRYAVFTNLFVEADSPVLRSAAVQAFRQWADPGITRFLTDPDPGIIVAAGRAIHDVPIVAGFPALASFITKIDCPTNLYSRVIDACFRLGTQQHAQMLAGFAAREDVPDWARVLAVTALADWAKPHPLDRVNGLWRPLVTQDAPASADGPASGNVPPAAVNPLMERAARARAALNLGRASELPVLPADLGRSASFEEAMAVSRNPAPAQRAFLRVAGDLLNPFNLNEAGQPAGTREVLALQIATVDAAAKLRVKEAGTPFYEKFADTNTPPALRQAIVPALATLRSPLAGEAVAIALADPDAKLRAAALPYLDLLDADAATSVLAALVPGKPGELKLAQAAVAQLGRRAARDAAAAAVLQRLAADSGQNTIPAGLRLDLREALRNNGTVGEAVVTPEQRWEDCLEGGDAIRGREVFVNNPAVQCLRCHTVAADGGTVGPALTGIGGRQSREYLLESIVTPNARMAPGFETVVLTMKDGRLLAGTVKHETGESLEVEIADADTGEMRIETVNLEDIGKRERGLGAMPEGLAEQLSPFEVRDLVEFLSGLK